MGSSAAKRLSAALCLCLVGAALSGLLLLQHHGEGGAVSAVDAVCGDARTSGCGEVARSAWSSFAGLPVAAYGIVFYLALALALALALLGPGELRDPLAGLVAALLSLGLLADLFLLGVQAFAIKAYCTLCILTYVLSALALVALLPAWRGARGARTLPARPDGRLAIGGWLLGTLCLSAAVGAWNTALGERAARRQAHLLGAPPAATPTTSTAAPPPPVTAAPAIRPAALATGPAPAQDAKYWQQRAQQLQETLDDPRKLDAYFTEKAQHEYDTAQPVKIALDGTPVRGPATAAVKVVEFSDFLCPFCRNLASALAQFVPQAAGRVAVYFKNYPLDAACNPKLKQSTHPGACNVALGAVCAHRQGKFEAYHDRMFATELRNPQPADVVRIAGEAGLNAQAMQGCLDNPATKQTLAAQIAEANDLGIAATPTLYVNGKKLPRINDFVTVVDKEARKKGFPPLGPS